MNNVFDGILNTLFFVTMVCVGVYVFTQQTMFNVNVTRHFSELRAENLAIKQEHVSLESKVADTEKQLYAITNLNGRDRRDLAAQRLAEQLLRNEGDVKELKEIILKTPEKALELTKMSLKQESDFRVMNEKIESMEKRLQQTAFYNNILIVAVFALIAAVWKASRNRMVSPYRVRVENDQET